MIYLEFHVVGDGRVFVEPGQIAGVMSGVGCDILTPGTATKPVRILLRAGNQIDIVGDSAGNVLARAYLAKKKFRDEGLDFLVDYIEPMGDPNE